MPYSSHASRRSFLAVSGAAFATPLFRSPSTAADAAVAANDRINVAVIGLGSRGFNLLDELLKSRDAEIVACCDVDTFHYRDNPWGKGKPYGLMAAQDYLQHKRDASSRVFGTSDFREILTRDDIDAVVIATPDHWHAECTLAALQNGKDVYCEKPITHTFHEGQLVYRACSEKKAVFQTGSQQRSDPLFRRAVELVRNGHLGTIRHVEVGLSPGYAEPQGSIEISPPPEHVDYNFWCGPGPLLPYMRARHHRWWRGHRGFGGGVLMDWIGHHNDIAHWALDLDLSGPTKVEACDWSYPETDVYDTPHHYEIQCEYAGGTSSSISSRHRNGSKFVGENGWVYVTRGKLESSNLQWTKSDFDPGSQKVYASSDHMQNFLDCVRTRKACIASAETAHRSITPGHLGYVSDVLKRALHWDPQNEVVVNDDEANRLLHAQTNRMGWKS